MSLTFYRRTIAERRADPRAVHLRNEVLDALTGGNIFVSLSAGVSGQVFESDWMSNLVARMGPDQTLAQVAVDEGVIGRVLHFPLKAGVGNALNDPPVPIRDGALWAIAGGSPNMLRLPLAEAGNLADWFSPESDIGPSARSWLADSSCPETLPTAPVAETKVIASLTADDLSDGMPSLADLAADGPIANVAAPRPMSEASDQPVAHQTELVASPAPPADPAVPVATGEVSLPLHSLSSEGWSGVPRRLVARLTETLFDGFVRQGDSLVSRVQVADDPRLVEYLNKAAWPSTRMQVAYQRVVVGALADLVGCALDARWSRDVVAPVQELRAYEVIMGRDITRWSAWTLDAFRKDLMDGKIDREVKFQFRKTLKQLDDSDIVEMVVNRFVIFTNYPPPPDAFREVWNSLFDPQGEPRDPPLPTRRLSAEKVRIRPFVE